MFRYSETDIKAAIQECKRRDPTTAVKIGVPRVILQNKVKRKTAIKRKMGRIYYITDYVENILAILAEAMAKQDETR